MEGTGALVLDDAALVRDFRAELLRTAPGGAVPAGRWVDLPGRRWAWGRGGGPSAAAEVMLRPGPDWGAAHRRFDVAHLTRPTGPRTQTVALTTTPGRFGGLRWWWRCPQTGTRCAKLYLPNGGTRFLSRAAYGLAYASQSEDPIARAHRRAARLHRRLGSDERLAGAPAPPRPRGMRRATYARLAAELDEARRALDRAFLDGAVRILRRHRA